MNQITLMIRPNQKIQFPAICVHCAQPAQQTFPISHQSQLRLRSIAIPLCEKCLRAVQRRSFKEGQKLRFGWIVGIGVGLLASAVLLLVSPVGFAFAVRILLALLGGVLLGTAVWLLFYRSSRKEILPEKQNILQSARIGEFNHKSTTFIFKNQTFADRFQQLNESMQMMNK